MRWEAWPALLATLAWAVFLGAMGGTYHPGGPADWLAPLVLAGAPLAVSAWALAAAWRAAARGGFVPRPPATAWWPWSLRLVAAILLALIVGASAIDLVAAPTAFHVGLDAPVPVGPLLPGPSATWAYLAALALTLGAVARARSAGVATGAILMAAAVAGATVMVWDASAAVPTLSTWADGGCGGGLAVPAESVRSIATGELDRAPLGRVQASLQSEGSDILVVRHDTAWGGGTALLVVPGRPIRDPLETVTLRPEAVLTVDDLGADRLDGRAVRHCRVQVDGPSAVAGFPALRWLVGQDEDTVEPGIGLEAWRGTVDYWLMTTTAQRFQAVDIVLATVTIDGQPAGWPFPGLRASLHGASSFGGP